MILLAVIYIVFISLGLPDSLFGVAWPVVHNEFGIAEGFASVYSIIIGVCTGGVSFVAGKLIRRLGTGKVTFFSVLLTATGLAGMSLAPNIVVMMLFAVVLGYGAGAIDTGLNNFVSLHYKSQHMNWLHCFWGVGVTASPLIMSVFLTPQAGSWRMGYRVIAVIQLVIAAIVALSLGRWKKAEHTEAEEQDAEEAAPDKSFSQILFARGVPTSILSLGFYCGMEFLVGTWGATYLVNIYSFSPADAAKWISLYYGGIMLGRLVSGFISMKLSNDTLIRAGIITAFCGMIVFALPLGNYSIFGLLLIGFGFGPIFPGVLHSIPKRFGRTYSADITGYHMGGAYAIGFLVQLVFGFAASATTFAVTPFVLLVMCSGLFTAQQITLSLIKKPLSEKQ